MEGGLLDGLYWEYKYNDGGNKKFICPGGEEATGPCPLEPSDRNILYENRLIGLPRCEIKEPLSYTIKTAATQHDCSLL